MNFLTSLPASGALDAIPDRPLEQVLGTSTLPDSALALFQARHASLLEGIWQLLESLVGLDVERASEQLQSVAQRLYEHAKKEDAYLLATYYERATLPPRGATREILEREHFRIEQSLEQASVLLRQITLERTVRRRPVLLLIFHLRMLKEILEHHFQREETLVWEALAQVASEAELRTMVEPLPG